MKKFMPTALVLSLGFAALGIGAIHQQAQSQKGLVVFTQSPSEANTLEFDKVGDLHKESDLHKVSDLHKESDLNKESDLMKDHALNKDDFLDKDDLL